MTRITFVEADGLRHEAVAEDGISAMEAAVQNDVPGIPADCSGACSCATCHVHVDAAWATRLEPMTEIENDVLDLAPERSPASRLSCQIRVTPDLDGLVLHLPARAR